MPSANTCRVLHVATIDASIRNLLLNQLQYLQRHGYDVSAAATDGPFVPQIKAAGVRFLPVRMTRAITPGRDLVGLWRLVKLFRRERFTIVHGHTPKAGLLCQMAARLAGVPIILHTLHGFYLHDKMGAARRELFRWTEWVAASCTHEILSQNQEDIGIAERMRIAPPTKMTLLGNGIDLSRFTLPPFSPEERARRRLELGVPADARVIGFVGRLAGVRKGLWDLLAATQQLVAADPRVRLLICGRSDPGKEDAVVPADAERYGLKDRALFLGRREDVHDLLRLFDVIALPSTFEGLPRVLMEASAIGTPIVATDVKGNREAVAPDVNGLLVPLADVSALAAALGRVLSNPALAARFGDGGRRLAAERFDEQVVFRKVRECYERQLQRTGLPIPRLA